MIASLLLASSLAAASAAADGAAACSGDLLPASAAQGALVIGCAPGREAVRVDGRSVRVAADGRFVFGVARDRTEPVAIVLPGETERRLELDVVPREFRIERVDGLPPQTVTPDPAIAARIAREQARVAAARERDDDRADFTAGFARPVEGRISGVYGSQRILNGEPRSPHYGLDIAAPTGTPVLAPAPGIVSFSDELYLTGGTVLLDHGHGLSSSYLHLSRIDVAEGERVERGDPIGAVGATGRASGPHLHWGMNWFDVRIDPALLPPAGAQPMPGSTPEP